jgi:plastocyanin
MKLMSVSRWLLIVAGMLAVAAGAISNRLVARAQEMEPQTYVIQAGAMGPALIEVLAFAPQTLQVHRGDTVTWMNNSFHNIRFGEEVIPLVIAPEVDGQPLPQINPGIAFRTIESGSAYQGGEANSGLPLAPEDRVFSLVIDLEPGTYSYLCDVHPGMAGVITVEPDDAAIPTPVEAALQGGMEFSSTIGATLETAVQLESQDMGAGQVQAGSANTGRATVNQFFPLTTTISAGESVTFTNPEGSVEPHTVSWPPARNQDVVPLEVEGGPPILQLGPSIAPMTESGASVAVGDSFSSGIFEPGQSFMLTYSEAGVYPFTCNIHPGMNGVVIVEPAA